MAWRQSSSTRRDTRNYYNFGVGASTSLKPQARARAPIRAQLGQSELRPELGQSELRPELGQSELRPELGQSELRPELGQSELRPELGQSELRPELNQKPGPCLPRTRALRALTLSA